MERPENCPRHSQPRPVDNAELARIAGGVGPAFDVSKVEGYQKPSWYLPVNPRAAITTIR
ncbi:MAG: hypothetical protein IT424_01230 [Pirellulales bacterium]|nr:hypothetical protein [Pirellulales bacterium]